MTEDDAIHQLLYALIGAAKGMHQHHERLLPFGAAMFPDGEIKLAAASPENEDAPTEEYEQMLIEGFRQQAATIAAAGWAVDLQIERHGSQTDALRVNIEHREGGVACLYLPYVRYPHGCSYGELFRVEAAPRVFLENIRT